MQCKNVQLAIQHTLHVYVGAALPIFIQVLALFHRAQVLS